MQQPRGQERKAPAPAPAGRQGQQIEGGGRPAGRTYVNDNHWYGHAAPNDARYHLDHPFEHGHFARFGPSYRYTVVRIDAGLHRFWFPGGIYFEVAPWEWDECADWCWTCANEFVIYIDPDHDGWYLLYNVDTGVYVHVQYWGD